MFRVRAAWLLNLIRWRDWGEGKSPVYFGICLYLPSVYGLFNIDFLINFFVFFIFLHLYGIYGHMINDYSDREADRRIGKTNILGEMSEHKALGIVVLILASGIITSLAFFKYPSFIAICILSYFMATFYSLPPLRFKERGLLGVLVPAIAQQTLPVLLIFSAFNYLGDFGVLIFSIYVTSIGFRRIAQHLKYHHSSDIESGLETYTVTHGIDKVNELYKYSGLIETFLLVISLVWISINVHYGFLLLVLLALCLCTKREQGWLIHELFPTLFIPLFFATLLFTQYFVYVVILLFLIAWQHRKIKKLMNEIYNQYFNKLMGSRAQPHDVI